MTKKQQKQQQHTPKPSSEVGIRVFVYGTLKRLHYNHYVIEDKQIHGTEFLGCCYLEGPFQMRDLSWFPGVQYTIQADKKNRLYGEVYRVSEDTLKGLDILEGNGSFFTRVQVETPWKKAWMYMIPSNFDSNRPIITEGVWKPNAQEKDFIQSQDKHWNAADYFQKQPKL
jgi:gamma-glutamylcyclotransferase (GGCT)/AIG2-like uncharacterized protein YtfP